MYGIITASFLNVMSFMSIQASQVNCSDNLLTREQNTEQNETEPIYSRHSKCVLVIHVRVPR